MHPVAAAMLCLTVATAIGVFWSGNRLERLSIVAIAAYLVLTPFASLIRIENWRVGLLALEASLFLVFWFMAERSNRWWLTAAAGFQLISVVSFALPFLLPNVFVLTGMMFRLGAWALVILAMGFGVYEARVHRKARRPQGPRAAGDPG